MEIQNPKVQSFLDLVRTTLPTADFVKINCGDYKGATETLKNVYIKKVSIKNQDFFSFVYRHKRNDITKNYTFEEAISNLEQFVNEDNFRSATLFTRETNITLQFHLNGKWHLKTEKNAYPKIIPLQQHNKEKQRKIKAEGNPYFPLLGITSKEGNIYKEAQEKYRQINHYVEILSSRLLQLPQKETLYAIDMGSGKGYLTFALYDYIKHQLKRNIHVEGIEFRKDLVDLCNRIAKEIHYDELNFTEGTIENFHPLSNPDIIIALHACDTATDDAIFKGIQYQSDLIVVAPCCHKQIRREMEKAKTNNALSPLTKHGIFMERQAEMVTDTIRALILEYYGYSTQVFDFISMDDTPKNVLIVGERKNISKEKQQLVAQKVKELKTFFGIEHHYLESLCNINF